MIDVGYILLAIACILLNAFFVAAEFSMVRLRHSRVPQLKNKGWRGRILVRIHHDLDRYLSACQLGITLASLGLGWLGEPAFARLLQPAFSAVQIFSQNLIVVISFFVAFSAISFLHIVIGELMPKSMAIRRAENIALWTSLPLYGFYAVMYPFIALLNMTANALLRWLRLDGAHQGDSRYSAEEIKFILKASHQHDEKKQDYHNMMLRILEFSRLEAVDVMQPLSEMVCIPQKSTLTEKLAIIQKHRYTRYPVTQKTHTQIVGLLHAKDVLLAVQAGADEKTATVMRDVLKVQRRTKAVDVLDAFRKGMPHFALVYQSKKLLGFITLDDLLQEFLGSMRDEFHLTTDDWTVLPEGGFLLKGSAPAYVVEKLMEVDLSSCAADTVAGLILNGLERVPQVGDTWKQPTFALRVRAMDGPKITEVVLVPVRNE